MAIKVFVARTDAEMASCLALRRTVFIEEQNVPEEIEMDGEEGRCIHVLATVDGKPVGAARFYYGQDDRGGTYAKLQRVCVLKEHRGTGVGADLIRFMVNKVDRDKRTHRVVLGAQVYALDFYRKLGFVEFGDEYLDADIVHKDMERLLA
ncbi:MAG: GNAT family N-acetyltransferase [Pseudomonadota bacterium]